MRKFRVKTSKFDTVKDYFHSITGLEFPRHAYIPKVYQANPLLVTQTIDKINQGFSSVLNRYQKYILEKVE